MEAARPPRRRRRPRSRTVDRPVNVRLVRAASLVVVPAALLLLLTISTAGALPRSTVDPVFGAASATTLAAQLSTAYPARIPGTPEAVHAAGWYEQTISALGLPTEHQVWREKLPGLGDVELRNIITVVRGRSETTIVVVAHRDNAGTDQPLGDNASGTAALIELARGYGRQGSAPPPVPQRTLVLVSSDAGAYGGAGALHFARRSQPAGIVLAAIVLDGLGGAGDPRLAIAAGGTASPARALVSTAAARIAEQTGSRPQLPSVAAQLVDLGIPFAAGEQGPFLARGVAALTITTKEAGDPGIPVGDPNAPVQAARLGELGRATEGLIGSIDASARRSYGTPDSLFLDGRVASGWAVRLTLIVAVVPFAVGVLDLVVRGRRRALPLLPAARALRTRVLFWLFGGLLLWIGTALAWLPTGAPVSFPPYSDALRGWPLAGIALLGLSLGLGWLLARQRLGPARPVDTAERGAGYTVALGWLGLVAVAIALTRPYALVFVLPSLYAWLWLPLQRRASSRVALYALGLAGPAAGLVALGDELGLGALGAVPYVIGLAAVGYVPLGSILLAIAWLAAAAQLGTLVLGRYGPYAGGADPPPPGLVRSTIGWIGRQALWRRYDSGM